MRKTQTVYLARPGIPTLIEVHQREQAVNKTPFVTRIEMGLSQQGMRCMESLGLRHLVSSVDSGLALTMEERRFDFTSFL